MNAATMAGARSPAEAPRDTILSIQVMRGLAAVAVAIYHTHLILAQPQYGGIDVFGAIAGPGWLGVNFFFVLSGFIILHAHRGDIGRPERLLRYLWKRFSRVYPIYWVLLTVFIAAAAMGLGNAQFERSVPNLLSSYLLVDLTSALSLPLQVAWTLIYEVRFYAIFALLIIHRGLGLAAFALWILGIAGGNAWGSPPTLGMFHAWNVYFLFGMAVYALYRFIPEQFGAAILGVGIAGLVACIAAGLVPARIAQTSPAALFLLAFPFSAILLGAVLLERRTRWQPPGIALLIGNASYAIYLVHSAAITFSAILARKFASGVLPEPVLFALVATISVCAGIAVHLFLEEPLLRLMRKRKSLATRDERGHIEEPRQA